VLALLPPQFGEVERPRPRLSHVISPLQTCISCRSAAVCLPLPVPLG
jgi:hypothetical protein